MSCTQCNGETISVKYKGIEFEYCKSCGAVIISEVDFKELSRRIDPTTVDIDLFSQRAINVSEKEGQCNKCGDVLEKVFYKGIIIDRCPECRLLIFDNGELSKLFAKISSLNIEVSGNGEFIKKYCTEKETYKPQEQPPQPKPARVENIQQNIPRLNLKDSQREIIMTPMNGFAMVIALVLLALLTIVCYFNMMTFFVGIILSVLLVFLASGFITVRPQEAYVMTFFGTYVGTIKETGFWWRNPFVVPYNGIFGAMSLKARTLDNGRQKINDELGNPIEVGIMVTWQIYDTAKASFNVDNYETFLSAQCDSALRQIVRQYPYDASDDSTKVTLRGDSAEISEKLKQEIQNTVVAAGIRIIDARITHLAYSSEIAVAMLQRQQANAVIEAKRAIVDGAVGMVEMALEKLSNNKNVNLDDTTKANMVNNLLVVLCGNKESQPVIRNDLRG